MATCSECRFWDDQQAPDKQKETGVGVCRRHAPSTMAPEVGDGASYELWPMWPKTLEDEWCGEWEQK